MFRTRKVKNEKNKWRIVLIKTIDNKVPIYYRAADLMLLPSIQDMNPLCVVEALHSGLPIALSDQAGNVKEAVSDGENGWVLPVLDKIAYKKKLEMVFTSNKDLLQKMGRFSKDKFAQFWDSKKAIKNFCNSIGL